jgi:hypothetical protein
MRALQNHGLSVHANGVKGSEQEVDFKNHESFDVAFLPKGVKLEPSDKKGAGKKSNGKTPVVAKGQTQGEKTTLVNVADTVPSNKQRVPTGFGLKKPTTPSVAAARSSSRNSGGGTTGSTTTSTPGSGETAANNAFSDEIARLSKLPLDEFEREIAKKPRLLQKRFRTAVEEAKAKK